MTFKNNTKNLVTHSYMDYECSSGKLSVNIAKEEMRFVHPDILFGNATYQLEVSHVYSNINHVADTFMGNDWKLNIQQYVIPYSASYNLAGYNSGDYIYIDDAGALHRFVKYDTSKNKYVDDSKTGMTLQVYSNGYEITDNVANVLVFNSSGKLARISKQEQSTTISKMITYDQEGRPIKYYDTRTTGTRSRYIEFTYSNNKLKKMSLIDKQDELETIYYNYSGSNLRSIYHFVDKVLSDVSIYNYDASSRLAFTTASGIGQALKIDYSESQIIVSKGIVKPKLETLENMDNNLNYTLNEEAKLGYSNECSLYASEEEIYLGDNEYLLDYAYDQTEINDRFNCQAFSGSEAHDRNIFNYSDYYTEVVNNKNIRYRYYFNTDGEVTSSFEVAGDELLTLTQDIGYQLMPESNVTTDCINRKKIMSDMKFNQYYEFLNSNSIFDDSAFLAKLAAEDNLNYSLSFYLKIKSNDLTYAQIVTRIGDYCIDRSYIDIKAYHAWQYVEIPIRISNVSNAGALFSVVTDAEGDYDLANVRIKPSTSVMMCLRNQNKYFVGNDCEKVTLTYNNGTQEIINTNNSMHITNSDIIQTYKNYCDNRTGYEFVCRGGKFRIPNVTSTIYHIDSGEEFSVTLDNNFIPGIRTKHSKDKIIIHSYYDCTESDEICITNITETTLNDGTTYNQTETTKQDYQGRVLVSVDRYGKKTVHEYDTYGNLISTTSARETDFDSNNNLLSGSKRIKTYYVYEDETNSGKYRENIIRISTDEASQSFVYDRHSKPTYSKELNSAAKNYSYDKINRLVSVISGNNENSIIYDPYGKLVGYADDINQYNFTYDKYGHVSLTSINTSNGKQNISGINVDLDIKDKYTSTNYLTNSTVNQVYNKYGNIEEISEGSTKITFTYQDKNVKISSDVDQIDVSNYTDQSSSLLNVTKVYDGYCGLTTNITYDKDNKQEKIEQTYNNGKSLKITKVDSSTTDYNINSTYLRTRVLATNRVLSVENGYPNDELFDRFCYKYEYHPVVGAISKRTGGNMIVQYSYEKSGKSYYSSVPQSISYFGAGNNLTLNYEYDNNLNIKRVVSSGIISKTTSYTYDSLNRITFEQVGNQMLDYEYTDFNSLAYVMKNGSTYREYAYDNLGRLTSYTINGNTKTITYDNNNLNPKSINGVNLTFIRNGLLSQYGNNTYTYDYKGLRYSKSNGNTTTYYYYNNDKIIGEDCSYGRIRYIYDHNEIVGVRFFPPTGEIVEYEYIKDATGSVVAVLKGNTVVAKYTYDAWGNILEQVIDSTDIFAQNNPIRFKGYYYDVETGLFMVGHRYYNPEWGRWIQPDDIEYLDPTNINGLNLYAYCNNDPVNHFDPDGHSAILALILAGTFAVGFGSSLLINAAHNDWQLDWRDFAQAGVDGLFAVGSTVLAMTGIGFWASVGIGAAMGWSQYAIGSTIQGDNITWLGSLTAIGFGALGGAISGAGASNTRNIANNMVGLSDDGARAISAISNAANRRMANQISQKGMQGVLNLYGKTALNAVQAATPGTMKMLFMQAARNIAIYTPIANIVSGGLNQCYNVWGWI